MSSKAVRNHAADGTNSWQPLADLYKTTKCVRPTPAPGHRRGPRSGTVVSLQLSSVCFCLRPATGRPQLVMVILAKEQRWVHWCQPFHFDYRHEASKRLGRPVASSKHRIHVIRLALHDRNRLAQAVNRLSISLRISHPFLSFLGSIWVPFMSCFSAATRFDNTLP